MLSQEIALTPDEFAAATGVSRETLERLEIYVRLLEKWQTSVNLVSAASLGDVWRRHLLDSAQLFRLVPTDCRRLIDLGSGAGFPGLVLAIMGVQGVELVESDQKKAVFLREAARETKTDVIVHARRIEDMAPDAADVVTARALAPLKRLLPLAKKFAEPHTICLFLKGTDVERELAEAARDWHLWYTSHTSMSDSCATIIKINRLWHESR